MPPLKYDPEKIPYSTKIEGDSLTEQEHKDSCDINLMVKNALRGLEVRGGSQPQYGFDDTTIDGVQFRIQKDATELQLQKLALDNEFTQEELDLIPKDVQTKFKFKLKKKQDPVPVAQKQNEQNEQNQPPVPNPDTKNHKPS